MPSVLEPVQPGKESSQTQTATKRAQRGTPISEENLGGPALRAFFSVAALWQLSKEDQIALLGTPDSSTFDRWKGGCEDVLSADTLDRISYVLGIYEDLHVLLPTDAANTWVNRPNSARPFGGKPAIDLMRSGDVKYLLTVRQYLDAQCGR